MIPPEAPGGQRSSRATIPRWLAYVLAVVVWGAGPWALSFLTSRYGWTGGSPGLWNVFGLLSVVVGSAGMVWTMSLHFGQTAEKVRLKLAQGYLLTRGPYAFSRHPMYLSELILLFGWTVFYGSPAVAIAWLLAWALFTCAAAPLEERAFAAQFGDAYLEYKRAVPRWFVKTRS
jgi:protein-S-isoprenylcysteine O-methyltransferase Ste14